MDPHESEEDDERGSENKKVKNEAEQSGLGLRILKTEPVDDDGIIQLDDDELSPSCPYQWSIAIVLDGYLPKS